MGRLLAGVMCCAWVFAGWRNLPRLGQPAASAAGFTVGGTVLLAFWLGRRTARASAIAAAVASAEATAVAQAAAGAASEASSTVNLYLGGAVPPARPVANPAERAAAGLDSAPWLVGAHRRIELDETEALDAALDDVRETVHSDSGGSR